MLFKKLSSILAVVVGVSSQSSFMAWSFEQQDTPTTTTSQQEQTVRNSGIADLKDQQDLEIIERRIKSIHDKARNLQGVECGQVLDTIPVDVLAGGGGFELLANAILPAGLPDALRAKFNSDFGERINYGVQIKKMCASCDSAVALTESNDFYLNPGFNKYCGETVYGHDMIQSGLVTYPIVGSSTDPTSIKVKPGTLPLYILSRPTKASTSEGPSSEWLTDIDTIFGFLASMVLGSVGVSPDFMGYGSSTSERGYAIRDSYVTSTIPLVMKAGFEVSATTNCESAVGDTALYSGVSEGGYGSVAVADGLKNALGIEPDAVFAASGPYRMGSATLLTSLVNFEEGTLPEKYIYISAIIGASFSSTNPSVANFGSGQEILADENKEQILEWLSDPSYGSVELNEALLTLVPEGEEPALELVWNSEFVDFLRTAAEVGETSPCNPSYEGYEIGKVDKICDALIQNDLIDVLEGATYPVILCHSQLDKLVTFDNLPNVDSNPFLVLQEKPGDHGTSTELCLIDNIFYIAGPEAASNVPDPKHVEGGCPVDTNAPTTTPFTTKAPKDKKAKAPKKIKTKAPKKIKTKGPKKKKTKAPKNRKKKAGYHTLP